MSVVLEPQELFCVACGAGSFETRLVEDHVVPRAAGGDNSPANLQWLCWSCNSSKCDRPWEQWLERERGIGLAPHPLPVDRPKGLIVYAGRRLYDRRRGIRWRHRLTLTVSYREAAA